MVAQLGLCMKLVLLVVIYNAWPGVEAFLFDTYFKAMNGLKESQAMNLFVIYIENHKQSSFNISSQWRSYHVYAFMPEHAHHLGKKEETLWVEQIKKEI